MVIGAALLAGVALTGASAQGRVRSSLAGAALPGLAVAASLHQGPGVGEAAVAAVFAGATLVAWVGVIPAPVRTQVATALASGVTLGLGLAAARLAAGWWSLLGPLVLALCLTGFEVIGARSSPFGEWGSLAHSQTRRRWALTLARGGPYAVTFTLVLVSAAFGYAAARASWACAVLGIVGVLVLGILSLPGSRRRARSPEVPATGLLEDDASLFAEHLPRFLDGRMSDEELRELEAASETSLRRLLARTVAAAGGGSALVVWAEGAGLVTARAHPGALARARAATWEAGCVLVASWLVLDPDDGLMSNLTTVIDATGEVVSTLAKAHPVPGLEASRTRPDVSSVSVVPTALGRLGVCICFDADHPDVWRALAGADLGVLAVPASDWPAIGTLHADMARLRARSIDVALVRPARDGVSRVVGATGRVQGSVDHRRSRTPDLVGALPAAPSPLPVPR